MCNPKRKLTLTVTITKPAFLWLYMFVAVNSLVLLFPLPDVFSVDESEQTKFDHVPRGAVFISHQIQSHGHMGVTVVTAEVMLWYKTNTQRQIKELHELFSHSSTSHCSPSYACIPLRHRALRCPRHWIHWRTLC